MHEYKLKWDSQKLIYKKVIYLGESCSILEDIIFDDGKIIILLPSGVNFAILIFSFSLLSFKESCNWPFEKLHKYAIPS